MKKITGGTDDTDDSGAADDTSDPDTGIDTPDSFWTAGPALSPACTPQIASGELMALSCVVLVLMDLNAGVVQWNRSTGIIECVVGSCDLNNTTVV